MRSTFSLLPAFAALPLALGVASAHGLELDVPAQSLDAALTDFAEQANVRLLFDASLTRGSKAAPALKGDYSVAEGLERLLQGSGLTYRIDADGTVSLLPRPVEQGAMELDSTLVNGQLAGRPDLPSEFAGGQVARGGRIGLLGNQDMQDTPFSIASYTSGLIRNRQAQTLGEVLRSDPAVRQSYGFGNFSQVFVIRGFPLVSDDIAFNGLFGVLPRQIIATEAVERVEVFKGSSAFLNGVSPSGSGIGGGINLVSKRAENDPTRSISLDYASDSRVGTHLDLGQRFGEDNRFGARMNLAQREGETAVEDEHNRFSLAAFGLDYRGDRLRLAADFGYQKQRVNEGRSVVYLSGLKKVPKVPDANDNYAQPWAWSQLEDSYGMLSGEYDVNQQWTAYLAVGGRYTRENGVYSSLYVSALDGTASVGRLYAPRDEESESATAGLRGNFATGPVSHQLNLGLSGNWREFRSANESTSAANRLPGNLYNPFPSPIPRATVAGDIHHPRKTGTTEARSVAVSDTLGFFDERALLTLGVRRQSIATDGWSAATGLRTTQYDDSITTPVYGLVIKATDYLSFYANRIEGLAPGPTAPSTASNSGEMFAPFRSKQIEAGVKLDWGTFGGSLGVYRIEQPQGVTNNGVFGVDAEQRNRGVELSLFGELQPGLRLLAGGTLMDTELRGTANGSNDGNRAVGVPEFQYNLGLDWDVPGVPGLAVNGLLMRTGGQFYDSANELSIPAWTRVDLGARYAFKLEQRDLTLRANLENVADEGYWESTNGGYLTQGAPRTFKLSATLDF
ncbi:TonB-dependent receptor [Metapseudomonas resinovorans]|uniref:Putative TonB-dependent receptor n=1 Tax=Metapseudomonas resinovorans NBRC 106553 TaxID=1245471 RepID=S6AIF6_METRE|nr:TonB-dependent receptor [Pseudomonas resinovorans]BAN48155.1 putative TonB-dependent receptor [Pseudomonas resinovorans NBRC 106553]